MEGELGVRRQETRLTYQVLAEAFFAAEVTRILAERTIQRIAAKPLPVEQVIEVVLPQWQPLC